MTEEEKKAAEAIALATAQEEARIKAEEEAKKNAPDEAEATIKALEAEKNAILEREANYKLAYLKEKKKNDDLNNPDETDDERVRRITREELANARLGEIDKEKEALLQKTLKENKELRLANQNKPANSSTGAGGSTEQPIVVSTVVTPEQIAAFKARGWTEKDIERYKKNLQKNSR